MSEVLIGQRIANGSGDLGIKILDFWTLDISNFCILHSEIY